MEIQLSNWSVEIEGALVRKGSLVSNPLKIVYIEDHPVYRGAVIKDCIMPFFSNAVVHEFANGDEAYAFILAESRENRRIDLIITDVNHPGLNGCDLMWAVKFPDENTRIPRIPVLILALVEAQHQPELVEISDSFLSKTAEVDEIIDCIEQLLYK